MLVVPVGGVTSHPDAVVRDRDAISNGSLTLTPFEIKDIIGHVVPVLTHVFGVVQFLVDAARLVQELGARGPGGSKSPGTLRRMEVELLDSLAGVEGLDVGTAILRHPVDSICADEDNKLIVSGALNHSVDVSNLLIFVGNVGGVLMKEASQALPVLTTVTGSVDGSFSRVHEHDFVVESAPHKIVHLSIQIECLEVDGRCHVLVLLMFLFGTHSGLHRS